MTVTALAVRAPATFLGSTVGRKVVMAVTGVVLIGFVFAHMVGNLQLYAGREALNHYAVFLRTFLHGAGIWIFRTVMLLAVGLHVWSATTLTLEDWDARPQGYRLWKAKDSTYASRTMRWGGVMLALFIVYHLLHLTIGSANPDFRAGDVYHNVVVGFRVWYVSAVYIVAMVMLGLHLDHGVWSCCQTLGLQHPRYKRYVRTLSRAFAVLVVLGNISFPIAVLAGVVKEVAQ
jgi:succinate dehydrogenase / fumarate reductase, cytochrome b subunit